MLNGLALLLELASWVGPPALIAYLAHWAMFRSRGRGHVIPEGRKQHDL